MVRVQLSSGPAGGPSHLTGYDVVAQRAGWAPLASPRERPPLRWSGVASGAPALRRRQAAWRQAASQKRRLEPTVRL